jgi:rifampicin phosphotransferase
VINILAALAAGDAGLTDVGPDTRPRWHAQCLAVDQAGEPDRAAALHYIAGHRTPLDYELAQPRWSDVPGALDAFVAGLSKKLNPLPDPGSAADLQALKEDAKHEVLRVFAVLRRLALELDRRFALGGQIFQLRLDEIAGLSIETAGAMQIMARTRRLTAQRWQDQSPPPALMGAREIEALGMAMPVPDLAVSGNCKGRGTRVAGKLEAKGRAYVASAAEAEVGADLAGFRDGDILVAPMVHPDWLGIVLRAGGVVVEIGGWLSHMAIVAREHDVAMIVAVPNAGQIRTGDRLRLMPDGRILAERDVIARLELVVG